MPATTFVGTALGFTLTCWKNGLCMLPWYRKPWEHAVCMGLGAYGANWVVEQEEELIVKIEERYAQLEKATQERSSAATPK